MTERVDGLLVIDKPTGITSRDAVDRAWRWFPRGTRLGHSGTLDPLATGVLVLCVGAATRLAEYVQRMPKTYQAGILLGAHSDTDDADGEVAPRPEALAPTLSELRTAAGAFVGEIDQVPPAYSAAKVTGRRAYALARRGEAVSLAPRRVAIHAIEIVRYGYPNLDLVVRCGKGTYIRSLARDLGVRLGCGGYIETLRRTAVGTFDQRQAVPLDTDSEAARQQLLPLARAVVDLPALTLSADEAQRLCNGRPLPLPLPAFAHGQEIALFAEGAFVAIGKVDLDEACLRPDKVFAHQ